MDPKNFAKLDPKLRETYERVMGTSIPQKPSVPPPPPTTIPSAQHTTTPAPAPHIPTATIPAEPTISHPSTTVASSPEVNKPQPILPSHEASVHQPEKTSVPTEPVHPHTTIAVHTATATPTHAEEKKEQVHESGTPVPSWKKALFIIVGIAFFSAYAIFWLLFFKVQLPF